MPNALGPDANNAIGDAPNFSHHDYIRRDALLTHIQAIPVFTGADPTLSVEKFKSKFLNISNFLKWNSDEQFFAIQQRIAGLAQTVLFNNSNEVKDANDVFQILTDRFQQDQDSASLIANFWNLRQDISTPIRDFIATIKAKANKIIGMQKVPEESKKTMLDDWTFSHLLKSMLPHLRRAVIARNPTTIEELISVATAEERAALAIRDSNSQLTDPSVVSCLVENVNRQSKNNNDKELEEIKSQLSILTSKFEDLALSNRTQAVNPTQCFICNRFGHTQYQCRSRFSQTRENFRGENGFRSPERERARTLSYNRDNSRGRNFQESSYSNFGGRNRFRTPEREQSHRHDRRNFQRSSNQNFSRGRTNVPQNSNADRRNSGFSDRHQSQDRTRNESENVDNRRVYFESSTQRTGGENYRGTRINSGSQHLNYRGPR